MAFPLLSFGTAAAGGIFSAIKGIGARKKQRNMLKSMHRDNETWYNKEYNTNYLDNADVKSAITTLRERIGEQNKRADGSSAMRGGSDEAKVAQRAESEKTYADTLRNIAGQGTAYKRRIQDSYLSRKDKINSGLFDMYGAEAESANNLASNSVNTALGATYQLGDRSKWYNRDFAY